MDKHIIRENAGKLWRLLSTDVHRKWNLQEVKELTGFNVCSPCNLQDINLKSLSDKHYI